MTYEELVRAIGPGFHPDTYGDEYVGLPEGVTAEIVDDTVAAAWKAYATQETNHEPYGRALAVFRQEGWADAWTEGD